MFKIVEFKFGLGNQIFQYELCRWLNRETGAKVYGYYNKEWLQHQGLEVHKVLDIKLPPETWWTNAIVKLCKTLRKMDIHWLWADDATFSAKAIFYSGFWQTLKYSNNKPRLTFRPTPLSTKNANTLADMADFPSVSLHVRRGDYVGDKKFEGFCSPEYYRRAIALMQEKMPGARYYVFSDDIEWVRRNMQIPNACYVDWNTGKDSWLDMALMSACQGHIIANSTFSYWAARLGREDAITICPVRFSTTLEAATLAPEGWIAVQA